MVRHFALALGLSTGLAGCLGHRPPAPLEPVGAGCRPEGHFAFLETGTRVYRQGAAIAVRPMVDISPAGTEALAPRCVSGWSVSGPARLSADRATLTIDPQAPAGSEVAVTFRYRDEPVVARLRVVARDAVVLTGTRSQKSAEGCEGAEPVRELEFTPGDGFSVTFSPFETYKDYWGSYTFDPATGAIRLTVKGGNFVPPDLDLDGQAELSQGRLTLRGLNLGSRSGGPPRSCTYVF